MGMAAGMAANLGKDYADQYRDAATAELTKLGFGLDSLRRYFAVDNSYVRARLMLLLFPWPIGSRKTKDWRRLHSTPDPNAPEKTIPMQPREDENAPDLYIPFMAFVTYVLAAGFWLGVAGTFTPEILAQSFSSSLVVWFIEVVLTKGALYLMHDATVMWLDVVAFAGYKYVSAVFNLAAFIMFGRLAYWVTLGYTALAVGYMIFRSYFEMLGGQQIQGGEKSESTSILLVIIGAGQMLVIWFLGMV